MLLLLFQVMLRALKDCYRDPWRYRTCLIDFADEDLEKLCIDDKIQIRSVGQDCGLLITQDLCL